MAASAAFMRCPKYLQSSLKLCNIRPPELYSLNYSSHSSSHYDIIVVGGGMVGTALGCTLGKNTKLSDKRILLLEGNKKFEYKEKNEYSNRVSSLNPNTYNLLNKIGAWKHIADVRYAPVKKLQVWDGISDTMITFNHPDLSEIVAYIVENELVIAAVDKELQQLQNVEVKNEIKIKQYELPKMNDDLVKVHLEDNTSYTCNLLLGCDGANSQVRKAMGVQYLSWNYDQKGIVATVKLSEASDNVVAWQRCIPTGPLALLPLKDNLSSLVWCTTYEQTKQLLNLSDEQFIDALNEALWKNYPRYSIIDETIKSFNNILGVCQRPLNTVRQLPPNISGIEPRSRAAFPLGFGHATNYIAKRVALVGDAAHRVHPLAGLGVNLGFGDIVALNDILGESVYGGNYIGNMHDLKQYESNRQGHNVPTMIAIDGLYRLFATDFTPLVILRSLGLQFTQALTPLKRAIISHASQ